MADTFYNVPGEKQYRLVAVPDAFRRRRRALIHSGRLHPLSSDAPKSRHLERRPRPLGRPYFWVDPTRGIAGVILMQFLPLADSKALAVPSSRCSGSLNTRN
jgi:hypothetical protein